MRIARTKVWSHVPLAPKNERSHKRELPAHNRRLRHGVSFEEAVLYSPIRLPESLTTQSTPKASREIIVGHSDRRNLILVSFVETEERVRLINARKATRGERRDYEESVGS
jgi:uncharacterized protein